MPWRLHIVTTLFMLIRYDDVVAYYASASTCYNVVATLIRAPLRHAAALSLRCCRR